MSNPTEDLEAFRSDLRELSGRIPAVQEFLGYVESSGADGELDRKTKELLSLAVGVVLRCEPCILWHTDAALEAGATREEIEETLAVAVAMGGSPALAYAVEAHRVLEEFAE